MEYFLCSENLIKIINPKEKSNYLKRFGKNVAVAKLNFEEVENFYNGLDEDDKILEGFWCQEIIEGYIDVSNFSIEKIKFYDGFF